MDYKDDFDENRHSISSNDSNDDSEIESRLYAEIYFSNSIEGDDSSVNNVNNNDMSDGIKNDSNNFKAVDHYTPLEENVSHVTKTQDINLDVHCNNDTEKLPTNLETNLTCITTVQEPEDSIVKVTNNVVQQINSDNILHPNQNINITKSSSKIKQINKRTVETVSNSKKLIQPLNKKTRVLDKADSNISCQQQESSNFSADQVNNIHNMHTKEMQLLQNNNSNTVINPSNSQGFIKLLSPEFYNLFFSKNLNKKLENLSKVKEKKSKKKSASKKNVSRVTNKYNNKVLRNNVVQTNIENNIQQDNIIENTAVNKIKKITKNTKNNVRQCIETDIISISSESSNDSVTENSKYNTNVLTDTKLKENIKVTEDSMSDNEGSIFEVPVPRKPTPPLIDLKESEIEDNNDSCSNNSLLFDECEIRNIEDTCVSSLINSNNNDCNSNFDSNVESENELILNCTQIQNHVTSISEIKRLNQLSNTTFMKKFNTIEQNAILDKNSLNSFPAGILNNEQDNLHNSSVNERVTVARKITNTLNKKQKKNSHSNTQNMSIEEYFFQPMTNEMKSFYNNSWGGENFDVHKLQSKMSTDPNKWAVLDYDVQHNFNQSKRYFGMVCSHCQKPGHKQSQCPEKRRSPICHMCGVKGHYETSCHEKKCLTCGRRQNMYRKTCENCRNMFCSRCTSRGHTEDSCPDLWRRYHQTINNPNADTPINSNKVMKSQNNMYCCNCAKKGHDSSHCKKYRWSLHFPSPSYVSNYNGPNYVMPHINSPESINNNNADSVNSFMIQNSEDNLDFRRDHFVPLSTNDNATDFCFNVESNNQYIEPNLPKNNTINSNILSLSRNKKMHSNTLYLPRNNVVIPNLLNLPRNNTVSSKEQETTIRIKSKHPLKPKTSVSIHIQTFTTNSVSSNLKIWEALFAFLKLVQLDIGMDFLFKQDRKKIDIHMTCFNKYKYYFSAIINQFIERSDLEKSYMYLKWEKNKNELTQRISSKMREMSKITECPLQLYEQVKQLSIDFQQYSIENNLQNSLLLNRLYQYQQKLIMALYKEGCVDNSYTKLIKINTKLTNDLVCSAKRKNSTAFVPIFVLVKCVYYFNNVFVPHISKNLHQYIAKYKMRIEMAENIRNNPLLLEPKQNLSLLSNQPCEIVITEETDEVEVCNDYSIPSSSSKIHTPKSQIQVKNQTPKKINPTPATKNETPTIKVKKFQPNMKKEKKKVYESYDEYIVKQKERLVKRSKTLIDKALQLNEPHLDIYINALQSKLETPRNLGRKSLKCLKDEIKKVFRRKVTRFDNLKSLK